MMCNSDGRTWLVGAYWNSNYGHSKRQGFDSESG